MQSHNKYFTDLETECQQELLCFKFTIYGFEDADDDLIEEIFYRLNNSTPLSKPQMCVALMGVKNAAFVKSLLSDKFFSEICQFSALQRRKSGDLCTLLQAMMLLDNRHCGYEFASISEDACMQYAADIKNNYSEEQRERLFDILEYMEKVFPAKEKLLKKVNIPIVMLAAGLAMGSNYNAVKNTYRVGPMYFRQWFFYFFEKCYEEYKNYCSSGSIKREKTMKRIEIMERSLKEYFELDDTADTESENTPSAEGCILLADSYEETSIEDSVLTGDTSIPEEPLLSEDSAEPERTLISQDDACAIEDESVFTKENLTDEGAGLSENDSASEDDSLSESDFENSYIGEEISVAENSVPYDGSINMENSIERPPEGDA